MSKFGIYGKDTEGTLLTLHKDEGDGISIDVVDKDGGYKATILTIMENGCIRLNDDESLPDMGLQVDGMNVIAVEWAGEEPAGK